MPKHAETMKTLSLHVCVFPFQPLNQSSLLVQMIKNGDCRVQNNKRISKNVCFNEILFQLFRGAQIRLLSTN